MNIKKTIKEIVERVTNYGYIEDSRNNEVYYIIRINTDGSWLIENVDKDDSEVMEATANYIKIPLFHYKDDIFVEDEKDSLTLDLMFLITKWYNNLDREKLKEKQRQSANRTNKLLSKEKRSQAAKKAWETKRKQ